MVMPSISIAIIFGRDMMVPIKLEIPANKAITLRLIILPNARELLLTGVTSRVAMVPLSFSPAMDSGAVEIHPLKTKVIISMGSIIASRFAINSDSEEQS